MLNIPSLISTSAEEFFGWSYDLATELSDSAPQIRSIVARSKISNKEHFSISDDKIFIQYIALCLAYGQVEPGIYNTPDYRSLILEKTSAILEKLNLEHQEITFINQIEDQIISVLTSTK
ncbi:hypothetical protein D9M68_758310 [compost metagenome]